MYEPPRGDVRLRSVAQYRQFRLSTILLFVAWVAVAFQGWKAFQRPRALRLDSSSRLEVATLKSSRTSIKESVSRSNHYEVSVWSPYEEMPIYLEFLWKYQFDDGTGGRIRDTEIMLRWRDGRLVEDKPVNNYREIDHKKCRIVTFWSRKEVSRRATEISMR